MCNDYRLIVDIASIVEDFEDRKLAFGIGEQFKPDLRRVVVQGAMAPGIAYQVVENLLQLVRVHQGLEVTGRNAQMDFLVLARLVAGCRHELFQPRPQVESLGRGLLAAGQLQDVFDNPIHSLRVVLNNLGQTSIRAVQFLRFLQ